MRQKVRGVVKLYVHGELYPLFYIPYVREKTMGVYCVLSVVQIIVLILVQHNMCFLCGALHYACSGKRISKEILKFYNKEKAV